jgi:PDZ domain-containing secreted protein
MKRIIGFSMLLLMIIMFFAILVYAQGENHAPFVSNIHAGQRSGTKLVDITYDVSDPDGDLLTITVAVSNDGGKTFAINVKTFIGDVGNGIAPGNGKKIIWDAGIDAPNVYGTKRT